MWFRIFLWLAPFVISTALFAQSDGQQNLIADQTSSEVPLIASLTQERSITIRGKVTDAKTGDALPGANVYIRALGLGVAADPNGAYSLVVPEGRATEATALLAAKIVGFKEKTQKVSLKPGVVTVNFALDEDIFQAEEVVVTGIASKNSKSIAQVAASRISVTDLTKVQNYQSLSQLVTGKISGVNVSIASGNVGSGWNFFVRGGGGLNGNGQPLIYVDGVRIENLSLSYYDMGGQKLSSLSSLNPADIENVEILKGPAAASTYGTNASNGVVLITTKSGKLLGSGKGYTIGYQYNFGVNTPRFKYPSSFLNADTINGVLDTPGMIREHTLSITGGGTVLRYYASFQNRFDQGLIPAQNYMDRNSLKANINAVPSEEFSLKVNTAYTWSTIRRPPNDDAALGWLLNALDYYPAYATCKKEAIQQIKEMNTTNEFVGSASMAWRPLANLEINAGGGVQFTQFEQDRLYPYGYVYTTRLAGERALYKRESRQVTYDVNARYAFKNLLIDKLDLNPVIGSQIVSRRTTTSNIQVRDFANAAQYDVSSATTIVGRGDFIGERREAGIYADLPFSYGDIYFWTLGARKDYSSAVGSKSPSITYPHGSLAVRLDRFGILPDDVGLMKVRASYGESGQLPNTDDGIPLTYQAVVGGSGLSGLVFNGLGNAAIEPERIKEYELGFDMEFLKMFSLEFTVYLQNATKSIVRSAYASSSGLGNYTFPYNVGSVENKGFESLLQINPIKSSDYDLSLSFIWNYQKNEVKDLGYANEIQAGRLTWLKPGMPKFEFYDQRVLGATFDATGKYKGVYIDSALDASGKMAAAKFDFGSPFPSHSGSVSVNFRFLKNFSFFALAEWGIGNRVFSYTIRRATLAKSYMPYLELEAKLGLQTTGRPWPNIPALTPGTAEYIEAANQYAKMNPSYYGMFIYDADYIYFREASLSYDLSELMSEYIPRTYVSGFQAGVSVRNVQKWTKYLLDPELNFGGGDLSQTGTDWATLPQPRTFNFWIKCTF